MSATGTNENIDCIAAFASGNYSARHTLDMLATYLRACAADAKNAAANHGLLENNAAAEHWIGRAQGLMDAHGTIMAILTAGREPIDVNDEVVFDYPSGPGWQLPDIDAHYRVIDVANGMITVQRAIHGYRDVYPRHRAPLAAVHKTSPGHRCPALAIEATPAGGAR